MLNITEITDIELSAIETLIPAPTIVFNENKVIAVNKQCLELLGFSVKPEDINIMFSCVHELYREKFFCFLREYLKSGTSQYRDQLILVDRMGIEHWVKYAQSLVSYKGERYVIGQINDVTQLKYTQEKLQKMNNMQEAMLNITQSIIGKDSLHAIYDKVLDTAIKYVDNAVVGTIMLKGKAEDGIMRLVAQKGFDDDAIADFRLPVNQSFLYMETKGKMDRIIKIDNLFALEGMHKIPISEGSSEYIHSTISAPIFVDDEFFGQVNVDGIRENCFTDEDLVIMAFIRSNIEIALKNYKLYEDKMFLSRYDSLTNLFNRTYFEDLFQYTMARAERYNEVFNLVIFDINGLKFVNDNFGHLAGDQLIKSITDAWKTCIRDSDILARYGGDEFIGIFFNTSEDDLKLKFDRLLTDFTNNDLDLGTGRMKGSFAFGISTYGIDGNTEGDLVRVADERMYKNKLEYKLKFPIT